MKTRHSLLVTLDLQSPYLVHGNDPGRFGLDATLMRNHHDQFVIPGTLAVGRILDAWRHIANCTETVVHDHENPPLPLAPTQHAATWFGTPHSTGRTPFETTGRLIETDLLLTHVGDNPATEFVPSVELVTRIRQSDETEAIDHGMLAFIEQVERASATIRFRGTWIAYADDDEIEPLRQALLAGLLWQSQIGAASSIGFGRLLAANVEHTDDLCPLTGGKPTLGENGAIRLALTITDPICVTSKQSRGNLFESSDVLSGAVIKGTIARLLMYWHGVNHLADAKGSALCRHFDVLRVNHGLPSLDGQRRPAPIPLSLVVASKVIFSAEACATATLDSKCCAPTFQIDWKPETFGKVNVSRNWGGNHSVGMTTHLRVRTAINDQTRQAKDGTLFAYEMKVARGNTRWLTDFYFPEEKGLDRQAVLYELQSLLAKGLDFIGKTKVHAALEWADTAEDTWPGTTVPTCGGSWTLTMITPACLFTVHQACNQQSLLNLYKTIFADLSKNSLKLSHFFASQSLAGGDYLHLRFHPDDDYKPYLLTDAGSIFVFDVENTENAQNCVRQWLSRGLPVPEAVAQHFGNTWDRNPYVPENGYGEIAVNQQHGFALYRRDHS